MTERRSASETRGRSVATHELRALARGGTANLLGAAVTVGTTLALTVTITRSLTKEQAGLFFAAVSLFLLLESIVVFGSTTGAVYFIARGSAVGNAHPARHTLRHALLPTMIFAGLLAVSAAWWAPAFLRLLLPGSEGTGSAGWFFLLALPFAAFTDIALAATTGLKTMRPTVLIDRTMRPVLQLVFVFALVHGSDPALALIGWALPYLIAAVTAGISLRLLMARQPVSDIAETPLALGTFWRFTVPRGIAGVAQAALQRLDILLVAGLAGPAPAALYAAATRFLVVGQGINMALATVIQPRLAGWMAKGERRAALEGYRQTTAWLILLAWPFYLVTAWTAPLWLRIFGSGYASAAPVVRVLAVAMLFATGCGVVSVVILMAGRTWWNLVNTLAAVATNIALDLLLIPRIGINGAATGWAVAIVVNNGLALVQVVKLLRMSPVNAATARAATLAVLCFALLPAAAIAVRPGAGSLLTALVVGSGTFSVGVFAWRQSLGLSAFRGLAMGRSAQLPHP